MPGLFSSLNATAQALNAQTLAIATTSKNLANMDNTDYSREYVVLGSKGTVMTAQGAQELALQAISIQQDSDPLQNQQYIREVSLTSTYSTEQNWYQQTQAGLGVTVTSTSTSDSSSGVGDSGLTSALDNFQSALQTLAASPTDNGARQSLVQTAGTLTDTFNQIDQNLAGVQASAGTQITNDVSNANTLLTNIAALNSQIASAEVNLPGSAVDFRDQREADLEKLAAIIPVNVSEQANGEDSVTTPDGSGNPVSLITNGSVNGTVSFNSSTNTLTAGSPATALAMTSGSIAGAVNAITGPIQSLRSSLNSLASQLVTSVNQVYNPTNSATGNFFDPSGLTAGTISVDSNLTGTSLIAGTGAAGDNSIALALANLSGNSFSTASGDSIDGTFTQYLANAVSNIGQSLSTANTNLSDQQNIQTLVQNQRSATSGVNMDEEMSNLVQYQRAYQASADVFSVLNSLLDTVVNKMGV